MSATEDWLGRWREGRTGWHESAGSAALRRYWPALPAGTRVLVPMCGKSADLAWLAQQGLEVIGVELSRLAIEAFFAEQHIAFHLDEHGTMPSYRAEGGSVTLICGDFFELDCAPCGALYDRGAYVALPPAERPRYARQVDRLLSAEAARLLITLEYDQSLVSGPPFAISGDEVMRHWPQLQRVSERDDIAAAPPKFRAAGMSELLEVVWRSP